MPAYAELLFVAGPQRGQRSTLVGKVLLAGRASECDIQVTEEFASRKHLSLELTADGWVVENLSTNPIWVNGKKYKPDKKIILDTGDVIRVALTTEMLYVAPGDDAEAALSAWKQANPQDDDQPAEEGEAVGAAAAPRAGADAKAAGPAVGAKGGPAQAFPAGGPPPGSKPIAAASFKGPAPAQAQDAKELAADEAALARKGKIRKYILFGGIMAGSVILLVVAVLFRPREEVTDQPKQLQISRDKIRETIEQPLSVRAPQKQLSMELEEKAMAVFRTRHDDPGNTYRCVKLFKLSLAYRNNLPGSPDVAKNFITAKHELIQAICRRYEDGYVDVNNKNWGRARDNFEAILRIYPVKEEPEPELNDPLWQMSVEYITYIAHQQSKLKKR